MKNIFLENMLRFGTKNLSEAAIHRRLLSEQVDAAAYGVPGNTHTNDEDFWNWYSQTYLSPSTGFVGQTLVIMKPGAYENKVGIIPNIVARVTVASSFNFSYRGGSVLESTGFCIWDVAATRNYDWDNKTMKVNSNEAYGYPGIYDAHDLVDATLSLVPDGTVAITNSPTSIPVVVGPTADVVTDPSKASAADPIAKKKAQKIQIKRDQSVSGAPGFQGVFPWLNAWESVPVNMNGYGFTMAAGGTEVPMQTAAYVKAWETKNMKKGKYIGPTGN